MIDRVEREMELQASLQRAWEAVTEPEWLSSWLADEVELELTPGGAARFRLGAVQRTGWIEEVAAPQPEFDDGARLVFWWSAGDEPASRVELTLTPSGEHATIVRVIETRPLEILDLVGIPGTGGSSPAGPMLVAA